MSQPPIMIKGTRDGLVLGVRGGAAFAEIEASIKKRVGGNRRFFAGSRLLLRCPEDYPADDLDRIKALVADMGPERVDVIRGAVQENQPARPPDLTPPGDERLSKVVAGTLRSGQRASFHGDIVLLGDANPGSELVASGHVIVMGALRGAAHAGATGAQDALVCAARLEPTCLRIAGVLMGRDALPHGMGRPLAARLRRGAVAVGPCPPDMA